MKRVLLSVFVFIIIFSLPFLHLMNNKDSWTLWSGNVENKQLIIDNTYDFMHYRAELNYFSDNAKSHMQDVRILYWRTLIIFLSVVALSFLLSFFMKKEEIKQSIILSCKSIIIIWIILGSWALLSFKTFFSVFHKLLFSGNYLFPKESLLIKTFPQIYFENRGIIIGISEIILCIFIIYLLRNESQKNIQK